MSERGLHRKKTPPKDFLYISPQFAQKFPTWNQTEQGQVKKLLLCPYAVKNESAFHVTLEEQQC
jgi:hypothetical protein